LGVNSRLIGPSKARLLSPESRTGQRLLRRCSASATVEPTIAAVVLIAEQVKKNDLSILPERGRRDRR